MVSRNDIDPPVGRPVNTGILGQMQRILTAVVQGASRVGMRSAQGLRSFGRQARSILAGDLLGTLSGRRIAIWMGMSAVVVGATLTFVSDTRSGVFGWTLTVVVALAWSAARLIVMRLVNERLGLPGRRDLSSAWGAGLLPYAAGVTPLLYALAWIGSLLLTRYYLERLTIPGVDARKNILWVAGFELLAATAVWISGNLSVLVPAS